MASERASALADDFAAANAEALAFVVGCSASEWGTVVPGEEWTVGVVLHHIAEGHANAAGWLRAMADGVGVPHSAESIDEDNVDHAQRAADVGRVETSALLVENGTRLELLLRGLSDQELDQVAPFGPAGGNALPTSALAAVAAGHVRDHLSHAVAAVRRGDT